MKTCDFSEFSYGFALTDSLVRFLGGRLGRAPIFPSLIQEGSAGGGYDLHIPARSIPIFLQFKIPQVLRRKSKHTPPGYSPIYYRMPLRTQEPNQHQMLLTLETLQPEALVLYATPLFHEIDDLDGLFITHAVHKQTAFIRPSRLGKLNDQSHHVSYRPGASTYWRHSEPEEIGLGFDFESVFNEIEQRRSAVREAKVADGAEQDVSARRTLVPILNTLRALTLEQAQRRSVERTKPTESDSRGPTPLTLEIQRSIDRRLTLDAKLFDTTTDDVSEIATRIAYVAQVKWGLTFALVDANDP